MKKATKAALLSALLFPGIGHLYLQRYSVGLGLLGVSLAGVVYSLLKSVEMALQVLAEMQQDALPLDLAAITELVTRQTGGEMQLLNIAATVLLVCWLVGGVDSYRLGRLLERNGKVPPVAEQ